MDFLLIDRNKNGGFDFAFDGKRYECFTIYKPEYFQPEEEDLQVVTSKSGELFYIFYHSSTGAVIDYFKMYFKDKFSKMETSDLNCEFLLFDVVPELKNISKECKELINKDNSERMKSNIIILTKNQLFSISKWFLVEKLERFITDEDVPTIVVYDTLEKDMPFKEKAMKVFDTPYNNYGRYPLSIGSTGKTIISCIYKNEKSKVKVGDFSWQ